MIEKLDQSDYRAVGLKIDGRITAVEIEQFVPQIAHALERRAKHKMGFLVDLSSMEGSDWKARWEELQFLRKYSDRIERLALVGGGTWEEVMAQILGSTVLVTAEARYFQSEEIQHAWHWVKHGEHKSDIPIRPILPKGK